MEIHGLCKALAVSYQLKRTGLISKTALSGQGFVFDTKGGSVASKEVDESLGGFGFLTTYLDFKVYGL